MLMNRRCHNYLKQELMQNFVKEFCLDFPLLTDKRQFRLLNALRGLRIGVFSKEFINTFLFIGIENFTVVVLEFEPPSRVLWLTYTALLKCLLVCLIVNNNANAQLILVQEVGYLLSNLLQLCLSLFGLFIRKSSNFSLKIV